MKILPAFLTLLTCCFLVGCMGDNTAHSTLPPAPLSQGAPKDVIREGDKITIRLTGVPDGEYVIEVQVPSSGGITVPLLTRTFQAIGKTPGDLANEISSAYKADKIYTNPHVTILAEQRYVNVGGDVRGPSRVAYTSDLTLLSAINSCGGFTEYANRRQVRIIRGQQVFYVNCVTAQGNPGADPAVYPGDQIYVPRTPF